LINLTLEKILQCARLLSQVILQNGGETQRVEDTINVIVSFAGMEANTFVVPTGITITVNDNLGNERTIFVRMVKRSINLSKLDSANSISRLLSQNAIPIDEAIDKTKELMISGKKKYVQLSIAAGLSSGFFALMFGGMWIDFITVAVAGVIVQLISMSFKNENMFHFLISLAGSFIIALFSVTAIWFFGIGNAAAAIAGGMMPILPGLAMVNAISDTINGNLVSANARGSEAALVAVALALGVSVVLSVYMPEMGTTPAQVPFGYVCCFLALIAFCVLFHVPKKGIILCAAIGTLGYAVFNMISPGNANLGYFSAAVLIALCAEASARIIKMPVTIFLISAVIPIVPGLGLFYTMMHVVQNEYLQALQTGAQAMINLAMIAVGFSLVSFAFKLLSSKYDKGVS